MRTVMKGYVYRQYTLGGVFLADYKSSREAAKATGLSPSCIVRAAHGERKTGGGYLWRKLLETAPQEDTEPLTESKAPSHGFVPVIQMDRAGNELAEFRSIACASRSTGIARRSICCAVEGTQHTAGGFFWRAKKK